MASNRRRERDIARRRYERRRQAELERRARAKRRNTVLGAVGGTVVVIGVLLALTFTVFTGGSSAKKANASVTPTPSTTSTTPAAAAPTKCAKISPNPPAKGEPRVPPVRGKVPVKLVKKDLKVGHGTPAKTGDTVTVKYVGVSCDSGKAFDASYTDGAKHQQFSFALGQGKVIPGWDQGVVGMKPGGVRELIIPAALAYGSTGQGSIKPNDTLIFVVTLDKVASS